MEEEEGSLFYTNTLAVIYRGCQISTCTHHGTHANWLTLSRQAAFKNNLYYNSDITLLSCTGVMWQLFLSTHPVACVHLNGTESTEEEVILKIQQKHQVKVTTVNFSCFVNLNLTQILHAVFVAWVIPLIFILFSHAFLFRIFHKWRQTWHSRQ